MKNAFACCAAVLHSCKMLSRFGKRLYTPAKCFPGLGNGFTPLQSAFPVWETTLHPCKMLSRFGKRFYIFLEIVLTKQLSFEI